MTLSSSGITGNGAMTIAAGGAAQNLTLSGSRIRETLFSKPNVSIWDDVALTAALTA